MMLCTRFGFMSRPPLPTAAEIIAIWIGETRSLPCPYDEIICWASLSVSGYTLGVTFIGIFRSSSPNPNARAWSLTVL